MSKFDVVIGIEIHIELNTKTKMFSPAPNNFNNAPNSNVHFIDVAYPGTLPRPNKQAVVKAIKLAKSLKMNIANLLTFDRKNYFYPDLPKGYQITQQNFPIGSEGVLPIIVLGEVKNIKIERIHLEEDTARSQHEGSETLLDFNRAGVPLIEIVSHPVLTSGKEAASYVETIRSLVQTLDISDAKMEEGSLRVDVNISLKPEGSLTFGTKVEIKNMNSIANIEKSISNEIESQTRDLNNDITITQATKRFDESTGTNIVMRVKTDAADYKYFPEPNINPIELTQSFIDSIQIEELPWERRERYLNDGLTNEYAEKLLSDLPKSVFFDSIIFENRLELAKVFFAEIVSLANDLKIEVNDLEITPKNISHCLNKLKDGEISGKQLKTLIPLLRGTTFSVDEIIQKHNLKQLSDPNILNKYIDESIQQNLTFIKENETRPERVLKFILGSVMKASQGQANPVLTDKLVKDALQKIK